MAQTMKKNLSELGIGSKIKALRQNKEMNLQDLAEKSGLAKALISQIENEQVSPPISTLLKISNSLNTDISLLFQEQVSRKKTVLIRKDERIISQRRRAGDNVNLGYAYEALAYKKAFKHMEPFVVTFEPKPEEELVMFSHEGEEFAFVLEGKLQFSTENETLELYPGDSLYFDSDQLHGFRALKEKPARALVVVYHK